VSKGTMVREDEVTVKRYFGGFLINNDRDRIRVKIGGVR
jgi:hypothetical protein